MQITSAQQLAEILARPPVYGWSVGALPEAPPDAIVWWRPLAVADAVVAYAAAMHQRQKQFTDADGRRAVIAAAALANPEQLMLGAALEPSDPDPELLEPWFSADDLSAMGGLAVTEDGATPIAGLAMMVNRATGWLSVRESVVPPADVASVAELRERVRHPGRWVRGVLPQEPDAELWVAQHTEAQRTVAVEVARATYGINEPAKLPVMLSHLLLSGPGGAPLLTATEAERLPYGGALALYQVSSALANGGLYAEVYFRRPVVDAGGPEPGEGGRADLVPGGEAAPAAGGS